MDRAAELRLRYLEKVVNNLMTQTTVTKSKSNTSAVPAAGTIRETPPGDDIRLVMPAYRVDWHGSLVRVDAQVLSADPDLHAYMREHHPTCFIN